MRVSSYNIYIELDNNPAVRSL